MNHENNDNPRMPEASVRKEFCSTNPVAIVNEVPTVNEVVQPNEIQPSYRKVIMIQTGLPSEVIQTIERMLQKSCENRTSAFRAPPLIRFDTPYINQSGSGSTGNGGNKNSDAVSHGTRSGSTRRGGARPISVERGGIRKRGGGKRGRRGK